MGLFGNKKKSKEQTNKINVKTVMARCSYCGRPQSITCFGKNDSWTCPKCKNKNYM